MSGYVRIRIPFATGQRVYTAGMVVPAKELTKGQLQFTETFPPVEQATAAPGEKRNVQIPKQEPEPEPTPDAEVPMAGLKTSDLPKARKVK